MGWNGSDDKVGRTGADRPNGKDSGKRTVARSRKEINRHLVARRGLTAGLIVIALGCGAIWWFCRGRSSVDPKERRDKARPTKIAEVKPQIATNAAREEAVVKLTPEEQEKIRRKAERNAVTRRRQEKLRKALEKMRPAASYAIFDHPSENRIAGLLSLEPGTPVLLPPHFTERFEDDFRDSCKEPIVVHEDDPEAVKQLKRDMIACKIELCNRMESGEKLADILSQAHNELRKLGEIKTEIERMTRQEIRENAKSEDDVGIYIEAANKILAEKGIAPMRDNPVLRRSLHRAALRNAERGTQKENGTTKVKE